MEENTTGQQATQPTGDTAPAATPVQQPAAGTQAPVQPVSQPAPTPAPAPQAQASQPPETDWEARFKGLQNLYQEVSAKMKELGAQLVQQSAHSQTLEGQLGEATTQVSQLTTATTQQTAQLTAVQVDNAFWNLISTEFNDLLNMAPYLQRARDPAQQKQILTNARAAMGGTVQQQATQIVRQQLSGVTPGASPPPGQAAPQFSKEEVLTHMDMTVVGTPEHNKWKAIWDTHPENKPRSGFVDPLASEWDLVRQEETMNVVSDTTGQGPWAGGSQQKRRK